MNNNHTRTLVLGAIIGAITGIIASYLLVKRADEQNTELQITPKDGVKLGVGIVSLFRLITSLND
jgi:hypothetical protein